jgi:hypothetical protein
MTWQASFVATQVALGLGVDEALDALRSPDDAALDLARRLRAPQRTARAAALAAAVHEVALAIDGATLR